MGKFFDLTFNTKEVIYIIGALTSFIYGISTINSGFKDHEKRIIKLEKTDEQIISKIDNYIVSNNLVNGKNRDNFFKFNAILPKETRIEVE
jgi:hypothetical protein